MSEPSRAARLRSLLCFALATLVLLWVALYNGYPLVWWDSGTYVESSFALQVPPSRPIFYGLFLLATHWHLSLWACVVAQSALVVYLIGVILDDADRRDGRSVPRDGALLAICLCLAIATALPWLVGWIMPDLFTGLAVLALYDIVLLQSAGRVHVGVALLLIAGLLVHLGNPPLLIGLTALLQIGAWSGRLRLRPGALRAAWACIAVALMMLPLTNWLLTGRASVGGGGHVFLVGRLLSDGTAQQLLADHCSDRDYQLCAYRDQLPRSVGEYLWRQTSPLLRIGGWEGSEAESWRVIRDAITEYPGMYLRGTVERTLRQLQSFDTAVDLDAFLDGTAVNDALRRNFAREYPHYLAARQQREQLPRAVFRHLLHQVVVASALLSLAMLAAGLWWRRPEIVHLHGLIWAAIILNAVTIALVNDPDHRYGARLAWLLPFGVLLSLTRQLSTHRAARARHRSS